MVALTRGCLESAAAWVSTVTLFGGTVAGLGVGCGWESDTNAGVVNLKLQSHGASSNYNVLVRYVLRAGASYLVVAYTHRVKARKPAAIVLQPPFDLKLVTLHSTVNNGGVRSRLSVTTCRYQSNQL